MSDIYHQTAVEHYKKIRGSFVANGSSLHHWCQENGVAMQNARAALLGTWSGPKATKIVERIVAASGVGN